MSTAPVSLLEKLVNQQDLRKQQEAWSRFARIYVPLLLAWALRQRLQEADAKDFVQEVLIRVFRELPQYKRRGDATFRGWLFTLVRNWYQDFRDARCTRPLPEPNGLSGFEGTASPEQVAETDEREYRVRLVRETLRVVRDDFDKKTLDAFEMLTFLRRSLDDVATELGITTEAALSAQRCVLVRIREELGDFLT